MSTTGSVRCGLCLSEHSTVQTDEWKDALIQTTYRLFMIQGPQKRPVSAPPWNLMLVFDWPLELLNGKWLLYLSQINSPGTSVEPCSPSEAVNPLKLKSCGVGARCVRLQCPLSEMNNTLTISVTARLWNATFLEDFLDSSSVTIVGTATLKLQTEHPAVNMRPQSIQFSVSVFPDLSLPVSPTVPLMVLLMSAVGGLCLLALICLLLWKCGFFVRRGPWPVTLHQGTVSTRAARHSCTDADGFLIEHSPPTRKDSSRKKHWVTTFRPETEPNKRPTTSNTPTLQQEEALGHHVLTVKVTLNLTRRQNPTYPNKHPTTSNTPTLQQEETLGHHVLTVKVTLTQLQNPTDPNTPQHSPHTRKDSSRKKHWVTTFRPETEPNKRPTTSNTPTLQQEEALGHHVLTVKVTLNLTQLQTRNRTQQTPNNLQHTHTPAGRSTGSPRTHSKSNPKPNPTPEPTRTQHTPTNTQQPPTHSHSSRKKHWVTMYSQ
ncbi:hypothetical protein WMY93_002160 [Mugilogobius chulae]|uniref:Integrin alpha third immunoglobulin-like domain-containing protein n=1 Tax=Mugilogobius chulae TaxID=88201 RepID=A0AAW0Q3X1_9GOBI